MSATMPELREEVEAFAGELGAEIGRLEADARRARERGYALLAADLQAIRGRLATLRAHARQLLHPLRGWDGPNDD